VRAIVFRREPGHGSLAGRTARSLRAAGVEAITLVRSLEEAAASLRGTEQPVLLAAAGAWMVRDALLPAFAPSATGRPLIGYGAVRPASGTAWEEPSEHRFWTRLLGKCGGNLERRGWFAQGRHVPPPVCAYLEPEAARALAAEVEQTGDASMAFASIMASGRGRVIHLPALDVHFDPRRRVLQLVTTIQIGGAEKVTLDLAEELRAQGVSTAVAAFGGPTRLAFPEPANFADLAQVPHDPASRAEAVARVAREFGADLVHAHLIRAAEAQAIRERGLPLVMTMHNMPQSWPLGMDAAGGDVADLLLTCSKAVETAVRLRLPAIPARTVWNGINAVSVAPGRARRLAGADLRRSLGLGANDLVLAAVANPRRQKRLDRLPEIVCELQRLLGPARRVRLLLAGAPAAGNRDAEEAMAALTAAIEAAELGDAVHWTGPVLDIAPILAASDALISVSEFEGLSLAHLEALAAGVPVVATDAGGTCEIAAQSTRLRLLPAGASAEAIAVALIEMTGHAAERHMSLPKSFTRGVMARRYRAFYPRAIERFEHQRGGTDGHGLWLITNNFSTGGAQSSARRLLLGLAARGIKVRAAVVQEHPDAPTTGRRTLLEAGIPVTAIAPPGALEAEEAVQELLSRLADDPPQAVVFWNLITSYKLLLADGLFEVPMYDVSPGEMYFASLAAYFANPRSGLPYANAAEYGRRLAGVVVKYQAEARQAQEILGIRAQVIRNGAPRFASKARGMKDSPGKSEPRRPETLVLGTAARLAPQKRIEDLLEALRMAKPRLPRCVLRIAGGVETGQQAYARRLRKLARDLPVEWCGELPETREFLRGLDIFLMISEPAGCPNASLEAMAAGLPVIATNVGGASEQVIDGHTGRLVPRGDPAAFAEALVALSGDAEQRRKLGANARAHVKSHFSFEEMVTRYAALFKLETSAQASAGGGPRISN
jgi:glycosyltransferase involved in cell wall biosynthesis